MADDAGDKQAPTWPLPKFYFSVQLGDGEVVNFSEVSGLEAETQVIEYRQGDSKRFSPIKMPGLRSVGNVTMRKGIFSKYSKFWDWLSEIKMNIISRRAVVINLLDENGQPKMVWTLHNAWPTKITGADLKSDGNEVAMESIEIAFETLEVSAT